MRFLAAWVLALSAMIGVVASAGVAAAQNGVALYESDSGFEDTAFALENAIIGKGLVIDYVSHIGEMLDRTGADVGSEIDVYDSARIFVFCSAVLSRKMMEADPQNIRFCPWGVFVYQTPGAETATVGYRTLTDEATPADSPLREIETLLDSIAKEAVGDF